jgi:hypothetical protein
MAALGTAAHATASPARSCLLLILRSEAGSDPYDRGLSDLIGELSTRSDTFRTRWAAHNVRFHGTGVKRFHHPVVGDLELTFETMGLAADAGLMLFVYTAEPGSKSEEALNLLASWAATLDQVEPSRVTDGYVLRVSDAEREHGDEHQVTPLDVAPAVRDEVARRGAEAV